MSNMLRILIALVAALLAVIGIAGFVGVIGVTFASAMPTQVFGDLSSLQFLNLTTNFQTALPILLTSMIIDAGLGALGIGTVKNY
jgi:hypothetical protein